LPARQSTLKSIEQSTGSPVTGEVESHYSLTDDAEGSHMFMPAGIFGRRLENVLVVEGSYTLHAKATVGLGCTVTRECQWSYHVSVGIDPGSTPVTATPVGTGPGGSDLVRVTFTPKDRYGNLVGPGAGDDLDVAAVPGCTKIGGLVDHGDGRYSQDVECDPDHDQGPGLAVGQPGRDPVVVAPPIRHRTAFHYMTTFICGTESGECCACAPMVPGRYATAVTLYNPTPKDAKISLAVLPTTLAGATSSRWPEMAEKRASDKIVLKPGSATTIDCCAIGEMLLGAPPPANGATTYGLLAIESSALIDVSATFTVVSTEGTSVSIDVERVLPQEMRLSEVAPPPSAPDKVLQRAQVAPPPKPQDISRQERKKSKPKGD